MRIELLQDFGTKKKGEVLKLNRAVSASLIARGIAKVYKEKKAVKETKSKDKE